MNHHPASPEHFDAVLSFELMRFALSAVGGADASNPNPREAISALIAAAVLLARGAAHMDYAAATLVHAARVAVDEAHIQHSQESSTPSQLH